MIDAAHFGIGVCKAVDLRQKTSRPKTQEKRKKDALPVAEEDEMPKKKSTLERFGRDLTALAAAGALPPLIGRRAELVAITRILLQSRKNNLILIGEPGVGKTGVVEGFAQLMADGSLPEVLGKTRVIKISLPSLVPGTKYHGEFEERMEAVVRRVRRPPSRGRFCSSTRSTCCWVPGRRAAAWMRQTS